MDAKPKLLEQVRNKLRAKHYSYRTEQQCIAWIRRFILHHGKRHPQQMSGAEVEQFLTYPAVDRRVSASTQNQALAVSGTVRSLNYQLKQLCQHNREGSFGTQVRRERELTLMANQLHELGYRGMNSHSLKPTHVEALVQHWLKTNAASRCFAGGPER